MHMRGICEPSLVHSEFQPIQHSNLDTGLGLSSDGGGFLPDVTCIFERDEN